MRTWLAALILKPVGRVATIVLAVAALIVLIPALHLLPNFANPFASSTTARSSSVVLKSVTRLSRYEAASGTFQVLVDVKKGNKDLPSFLAGSDTLYVGQGSDIAYVDFAQLSGANVRVSPDRTAVTISMPQPRLEPAQLNLKDAHVFTQQEGLLTRLGGLLGNDSGSRQNALYVAAQNQLQSAAAHSSLLADARRNTTAMLTSLLRGLGFSRVAVRFGGASAGG
jgi:Protein of unknown function (DUF4230)